MLPSKKTLFLFSLLVLLFSCQVKHVSYSSERKAVDKIVELYGGSCKYTGEAKANTRDKKEAYFKLEIHNSELINTLFANPEIPSSGIAFHFFNEIKGQKAQYNHVETIVSNKEGLQYASKYSREEYEKVAGYLPFIHSIIKYINTSDFAALDTVLNNKGRFQYDKQELFNNIMATNKQFGAIQQLKFIGYTFLVDDEGTEHLQMTGILVRQKDQHFFSVEIDPADKRKALIITYKS